MLWVFICLYSIKLFISVDAWKQMEQQEVVVCQLGTFYTNFKFSGEKNSFSIFIVNCAVQFVTMIC